MKRYSIVISLLLICSYATFIFGQGCSDAGACTIPAFKPSIANLELQKKNQFNVGLTAGAADHNIFVLTPQIGYSRKLGSALSFDTRITAALHSGNGLSSSGFGDVFINLNYLLSSKFSITGGLKIPLNRADKLYADAVMFPMDYQSTLGTLDLIAGCAFQAKDWHFSFAYQKPLNQNDNLFSTPSVSDPDSTFKDFITTTGFTRQSDVLAHISRLIVVNDYLTLIPGLLPIYHLGKDGYYTTQDLFELIEGSQGLTLNATLDARLHLSDQSNLDIKLGFPLVVREARPDGLTRSFVLGADYSISF